MIFNRIINDIVDWVRKFLHWDKTSKRKKPYKILNLFNYPYGILKLVDRATPRAVLTYIYTPKPYIATNVATVRYDYHICLDHLSPIEPQSFKIYNPSVNKKVPKGRAKYEPGTPTHAVTVLKASHYLDKNGNYLTDLILYKEFDFLGKDTHSHRDKYAVPVIKNVVQKLKNYSIENYDWLSSIIDSQKRYLGDKYYVESV